MGHNFFLVTQPLIWKDLLTYYTGWRGDVKSGWKMFQTFDEISLIMLEGLGLHMCLATASFHSFFQNIRLKKGVETDRPDSLVSSFMLHLLNF